MINTSTIKPSGGKVFSIGPDEAAEKILFIGSCRSVPYLNYLDRHNRVAPTPLRVSFIDPNDWHWDEHGNQVDFEAALAEQESNESVLGVIRSATIYVHEHYESYRMFNSTRESPKNIWQFGLNPRLDVCIPNFHDVFILFNDFMAFDAATQAMVMSNGGVPSLAVLEYVKGLGLAAIEKFCGVCAKSSFPEMEQYFRDNWTSTRLFWTANHITKHFSLFIFRRLNERFLHLPLMEEFWDGAAEEDLFADPHTPLSPHDIANHGITWTR